MKTLEINAQTIANANATELRKIASQLKVKGYGKMKKDELCELCIDIVESQERVAEAEKAQEVVEKVIEAGTKAIKEATAKKQAKKLVKAAVKKSAKQTASKSTKKDSKKAAKKETHAAMMDRVLAKGGLWKNLIPKVQKEVDGMSKSVKVTKGYLKAHIQYRIRQNKSLGLTVNSKGLAAAKRTKK